MTPECVACALEEKRREGEGGERSSDVAEVCDEQMAAAERHVGQNRKKKKDTER